MFDFLSAYKVHVLWAGASALTGAAVKFWPSIKTWPAKVGTWFQGEEKRALVLGDAVKAIEAKLAALESRIQALEPQVKADASGEQNHFDNSPIMATAGASMAMAVGGYTIAPPAARQA